MNMNQRTNKPYTVAALRHGGTHFITPIVRKLTGKTVYSPKGIISIHCIPSRVCVVFTRDPRNRLISNIRYKLATHDDALNEMDRDNLVLEFLKRAKQPGHDLPIDFMHKWATVWLDRVETPLKRAVKLMRFETLADPARGLDEVRALVAFLNEAQDDPLLATAEEAYEYSFGKSGTWTGRHSNWREWFGPKSKAFWRANFGAALTKKMGYQVEDGI